MTTEAPVTVEEIKDKVACTSCGKEHGPSKQFADVEPFSLLDPKMGTKGEDKHVFVLFARSCNKVEPAIVCISPRAGDVRAYIEGLGLTDELKAVMALKAGSEGSNVLGNLSVEIFLKATGQKKEDLPCVCKSSLMLLWPLAGDMVSVLNTMRFHRA
ncbi:Hypothetical protein POVN_LOCUS674 [uncultured virus]|nr:Hypothetical protein POVN_LOCUS674 [uncultured virus]